MAIVSDYDENVDLILYGDDGGYVNVLTLNRKFISDNNSDNGPGEHLRPSKLTKKDSLEKYSLFLYRVYSLIILEKNSQ
jgi:hypothetical protein